MPSMLSWWVRTTILTPAGRVSGRASAPALAGRKPIEFARTEVGAREVEDLIGRLEYGVFT